MQFKEIEFKYRADSILLTDFQKFCQQRKPLKSFLASGWDHFYVVPDDKALVVRHRIGPDMNQLTVKQKLSDTNNFIRDEVNLDLAGMKEEAITALIGLLKCKYNTSIFKNCFISVYDKYTFVYYVVYDIDMKELGRFVEIEMSESHGWSSEKEAMNDLVILEKTSKELGISAQSRVKRSLFEMFKK